MAAINLLELFNGKIFRIPDFQRGYAWEEKQLQELWDDIEEISDENGELKKHYTGTIYLEEITAPENEKWLSAVKFYAIVDGQQRLTTLSILIFELLKASGSGYNGESTEDLKKTYLSKTNSSGNSTIYKFCYSETDNNYTFLLRNIFENKSFILQNNQLNLYSKNLLFAKDFFAKKIDNLSHDDREIIFKKLTASLQFDIRTIEKDLDVQAVFETMNNRGKPLSTLEKLKNRLIYLSEKLDCVKEDKKNLRNKINDAWGKIYSCLAQNPDSILDEDIFLSAHLSLYRKPKEAVFSEKLAEEKVFKMFCNKSENFEKDESGEKEPPVSYGKIEDYIIKLSEAAPIWYKIHNSNSTILNKLLLLNSSKELKVFLLALLTKTSEESKDSILYKLEKILFRNRTIWLFDERTVATWGRNIYSGEESIDEIGEIVEGLIQTPVINQNLIQNMNNYFTYTKGAKGFHRWGTLKYFLFEYEEYLKEKFKETDDKLSIDDFETTTIEHVIPQQFWDNWGVVVNGFTLGMDESEVPLAHKILINTLGNLTILKNGKNSSLGNLGWIDKKSRFSTGSYNEIDISKNDEWTKKEILNRGIEMLLFLESKINGLKFTEEEMKKMLFYEDFVIHKFTE